MIVKLGLGDFTCPECGSREWGTSNCMGPVESMVGHCHGGFCHFTWPRTEDERVGLLDQITDELEGT